MHLHIVFVLLYSVCRSVNVLSCVDVIQSFRYVLRVVNLDVAKRRGKTAREKARLSNTNGLSHVPSEEKKRNLYFWLWLVYCCLSPTCYFHGPFTNLINKYIHYKNNVLVHIFVTGIGINPSVLEISWPRAAIISGSHPDHVLCLTP